MQLVKCIVTQPAVSASEATLPRSLGSDVGSLARSNIDERSGEWRSQLVPQYVKDRG